MLPLKKIACKGLSKCVQLIMAYWLHMNSYIWDTIGSHNYQNQCSLLISDFLQHSSERNFTADAQAIIRYNKFEEHIYKIIAILKDWCINM